MPGRHSAGLSCVHPGAKKTHPQSRASPLGDPQEQPPPICAHLCSAETSTVEPTTQPCVLLQMLKGVLLRAPPLYRVNQMTVTEPLLSLTLCDLYLLIASLPAQEAMTWFCLTHRETRTRKSVTPEFFHFSVLQKLNSFLSRIPWNGGISIFHLQRKTLIIKTQ